MNVYYPQLICRKVMKYFISFMITDLYVSAFYFLDTIERKSRNLLVICLLFYTTFDPSF